MASNLVVVALPALDDDVNSVSSEKAAHLTILFLGDALSNPNVTKIIDYVKTQAADLEPFALRVDHRGFLGEDEAEVLFFSKEIPWQLIGFRSMLLGNQEISTAYNSIPQHTDWVPHLTLGYPESPPNKDDWDPMGTQYVSFDRIAVWYGDSEGTEIQLTPNPKPQPSREVAAWGQKAVENVLAHYGVKGMHWGVRKAQFKSYREDKKWEKKVFTIREGAKRHVAMSEHANAALPKFNEDKRWKGSDGKMLDLTKPENSAKRDEYYKALNEEVIYPAFAKATREVHGSSPSGKKEATTKIKRSRSGKSGLMRVVIQDVAHADDESLEFVIEEDANGYILSLKTTSMSQSAFVDDFLVHYGVKGMKWGVRRRLDQARAPQETSVAVKRNRKFQKAPKVKGGSNLEPTSEAITAAVAQRKIAKSGVQSLTNAELRTLNERMNLEQNYSNLVQKKKQKGRGQKFAENQLEQFAGQQVQKTLSDPARIKRGYDYIKLFRSLPFK